MTDSAQLISGLITLVILGLVVRRTLTTQTVRVWTLVALPLTLLVIAAKIVAATPPASSAGLIVIVAGALAGAGLGYARGIHSKVALGPQPNTLVVQGNVVLVAILVAAFALRFVVRYALANDSALSFALSDAFLVFAVVSVAVARAMLLISWRRLTRANAAVSTVR